MVIEGVIITPLKVIETKGGDILHGMKKSDYGYDGFGEAYFSLIDTSEIKGWKRHKKMVLNLIVSVGVIRFVIYDDRQGSSSYGDLQEVTLSKDSNYCRLTIPPMVWVAFQGVGKNANMLLNIASIEHSPNESDRKKLNEIKFDWGR